MTNKQLRLWEFIKDFVSINLGMAIYSLGWAAFLLPYHITTGGVPGLLAIVYYLTKFPISIGLLIINGVLLLIAIKPLGWKFVAKTAYAVLALSTFLSVGQEMMTDQQGNLVQILGEGQDSMACVLGAILNGLGIGIVFLAGGSTGGWDIIAALVNKYRNISLGRLLLFIDVIIIAGSYLLFRNLEIMVVGYLTMFISMNFLDFVINGARQSVQFIIVSSKPDEIAHEINVRLDRGVTVLYGEGFYTKEKRQVLLILAKKYESRQIFSLIKQIDGNAFVSMSNVEGVFGEGFDTIKK